MAANIYDTGGRAAASNGVSPVSRTASSAIRNIWTIGRRGLGMTFTSLGTKLGRRPHGTPPDFHTASQSCFIFTVSGWGLAGYWILRSEERGVGKGCVSRGGSRWAPINKKKKY